MRGWWRSARNPCCCFVALVSVACTAGEERRTTSFTLAWDHWLWMERVQRADPAFVPDEYDLLDRKIRLIGKKTAREAYVACGLEMGTGETFIYTVENTMLLARLGAGNRKKVGAIHRTIEAWREGRTEEWYLDWREPPNSTKAQ